MIKGEETLVHRLHAVLFLAHLHLRIELMNLVVTDQCTNSRVWHHDLKGKNPALAIEARHERLRQDALKDERQLGSHLLLLMSRKDVDDAVDRLHRAIGMQCGKTEVAGFSDRQGRLNRLQVTQLAKQDDVRILAQDVFQGILEEKLKLLL